MQHEFDGMPEKETNWWECNDPSRFVVTVQGESTNVFTHLGVTAATADDALLKGAYAVIDSAEKQSMVMRNGRLRHAGVREACALTQLLNEHTQLFQRMFAVKALKRNQADAPIE